MVVTDSRKAAVRYKKAIDDYIAKQCYPEVTTLVAFSGDAEDLESGPDRFNEQNLNPLLRGRDLRAAFATPDYRVMLVANTHRGGLPGGVCGACRIVNEPVLRSRFVDHRVKA